MSAQPPGNNPLADFGANEWLVDELYQQYLRDKNSVDQAWWDFFADYHPNDGGNGSGKANGNSNGNGNGNGNGGRTATVAE